jgi:hypothetical protein
MCRRYQIRNGRIRELRLPRIVRECQALQAFLPNHDATHSSRRLILSP